MEFAPPKYTDVPKMQTKISTWTPLNHQLLNDRNVLKPNLTKLMNASQQSKRSIEAKCSIMRPESTTFSEDNNSDGEIEDVVETIPEPSPGVQGFSHASFPSPEPLPQPLKSLAGLGLTKSISESLPWKYVDLLSGDAGQRGKITLNGQVEDSPEKYPNVKTDSLTGGLLHVNDDSILSEVDQDDDRPAKIKSNENNKVKEQINYVDDLNDLTQSSETASEDGELLYYENSMLLIEQLDTRCTGLEQNCYLKNEL
ncbi:hypothetical protein MJG53_006207 [Ovis ammon polii x Ovis aries]|uniref:Uncharacterized protein n=1 Tax=Ovis ammon polii x Ovis aries TaxID=2918886 RepID=A0ACB9V4D1_9CETA|nr:hypothetical protein MJG53_006207 [Ovis ammon polii x Ovis aries]